uniref:Zinc transporter ZIP1 n=1 Tax=Setaria digitata TaxID=48799 RepID=A0A915PL70_9BILA
MSHVSLSGDVTSLVRSGYFEYFGFFANCKQNSLESMDITNGSLLLSSAPSVPIVPVHGFFRASLIITLFVVTVLASSFPFLLRRLASTTTGRWPILSLISVFGGGVFLATCLLDLLPDAKESLRKIEEMQHFTYNYPIMEIFIAIGFLIVLSTEQVIISIREKQRRDFADIDQLITGHHDHVISAESDPDLSTSHSEYGTNCARNSEGEGNQHSHSTIRVVLLVMALSLHAVFEGLSLGLVSGVNEIVQIFLALLLHKIVIGFSLGVRLVQSSLSSTTALLCSIIFAGQIIIGGFCGIAVLDFVSHGSPIVAGTISFIAQAVACGTFLYVTCFEILPREFHHCQLRIVKLLSLFAGFALIAIFIAAFPNG